MTDRTGQQLGHYQLIRLLGSGGFADVYLGEHIHLGTQAAIKVLTTRLTSEDVEGFRTEARTIARLKHPQIVRVLDFGVEDTTPFLVMDYAPHGTLRTRHPKGIQVAPETILSYVKQVADALHYAHEQKLIHRDIKPENMLIGDRQEVLLSDFGIATVAQSSRYQGTQEVAGTVAYMAPEQVQGHPRPASDQYSLGVVVYEWLTGERPFHGSFTEIATQHVLVPPPSLRNKIPTISPLIEQVVMTTLAKDPKERFGSVKAFATALEQAFQGGSPSQFVPTQIVRPSAPVSLPTTPVMHPPVGSIPLAAVPPTIAVSPYNAPRAAPNPPARSTPPGSALLTYRGHTDEVLAVAWAPDGRCLASGGSDQTMQIWDALTGETLLTYRGNYVIMKALPVIYTVAWSPDGAYIACANYDHHVHVVNVSAKYTKRAKGWRLYNFRKHTDTVVSVAWSPDGRRLASGSRDKAVLVWEANDGEQKLHYLKHTGPVAAVAWSPDSRRIASGGEVVHVWDAFPDGRTFTYTGHTGAVSALVWSPDGRSIVSADTEGHLRVWDSQTRQELVRYSGHAGAIRAVAWSPDGRRIASGGADKTVQVWDAASGTMLFTYRGHTAEVCSVAWSKDSMLIASASADKTVQVWSAV